MKMRIPLRFDAKTIAVCVVLFIFLVPVVPLTIVSDALLPTRNECTTSEIFPGQHIDTNFVVVSISYVVFGIAVNDLSEGAFGLVVVPGNGWYSVQFPPIGFENVLCG
jgi:hypothetical protein